MNIEAKKRLDAIENLKKQIDTCVDSAQAILLQRQLIDAFLDFLKDKDTIKEIILENSKNVAKKKEI